MVHLASVAGVTTPTVDAIVAVASTITGVDYLHEGLALERMGLVGFDVDGIGRYARDGAAHD